MRLSLRSILSFTGWTVLRVIVLVALFFIYVLSSALIYMFFYYIYIPPVSHVQPIHLQFASDCDRYRPVCSFPQAMVRLRDPEKLLSAGQEYSVSVSLDMPESEVNRQLGMFMVNISFISLSGQVISSSGRHFMLRYHSRLVHYMSTLFYWLPLVLGFSEERQVLRSEISESYTDHRSNPAEHLLVTVLSRHIEIYSSEVQFHARFSGLRYVMYYWPITTALYVVCNMVFVKFVATLIVWYLGRLAVENRDNLDEFDEDAGDDPQQQQQQPQRRAVDGQQTGVEILNPRNQNDVNFRPQFDLGVLPHVHNEVGPQCRTSSTSTTDSPKLHRASSTANLSLLLAARAARESPEKAMPRSQSTSSLLHSSQGQSIRSSGGLLLETTHGSQRSVREPGDSTKSSGKASGELTAGFVRHRARPSEST